MSNKHNFNTYDNTQKQGNFLTNMSYDTKVIGSIGILTLIILIGGVWFLSIQGAKEEEKLSKPLMGQKIDDLGAPHVTRGQSHPNYNSNPPTSGWHWGDGVAGPGIKDQQVPDELVLHSMEHGAAVLWYKDNLPLDQIDRIKKAFNNATGKKIMVPRKGLDVTVALASWNYLLKLKSVDESEIKSFIETNNDRAPEKAPI